MRHDTRWLWILTLIALVLAVWSGPAPAAPLDPTSFASLGANPFTTTGNYTIDTSATPPVLTKPDDTTIPGVVSADGIAVFTFDSITSGSGITIEADGTRPVALLSYGAAPAEGAAGHLGATDPPRPEPAAALAAAEQERAARLAGVATLAQPGDEASVTALAQVLATEPDALVRATAVRGLGQVGGEPALATLATALADPARAVRLQAIQAVAKVAGAEADAALAAVLAHDPDPVVRRQAVQTLTTLQTPEASQALGVAAADPSQLVRQAVPAASPHAP